MNDRQHQAETRVFPYAMLAIRPATHRQLKMFCARAGTSLVDAATQAIEEFLQRMNGNGEEQRDG